MKSNAQTLKICLSGYKGESDLSYVSAVAAGPLSSLNHMAAGHPLLAATMYFHHSL